eukprot:4404796-Prymnesium_polylepis.1
MHSAWHAEAFFTSGHSMKSGCSPREPAPQYPSPSLSHADTGARGGGAGAGIGTEPGKRGHELMVTFFLVLRHQPCGLPTSRSYPGRQHGGCSSEGVSLISCE